MTIDKRHIKQVLALVLASIASALIGAAGAQAAAPVKLVLAGRFGRQVNLTQVNAKSGAELEDLCPGAPGDICQRGKASVIAGGFSFPESVAGAPDGDVFVADQGNGRIDELTSEGRFVMMFGKGVDTNPGAVNRDVCTAASKDVCGAGEKGQAAGQLYSPESVAVDPLSGDVYVAEQVFGHVAGETTLGLRVQKFTAGGEFIFEIGQEVNESTKANLCTAVEIKEGVKCGGPAQKMLGSSVDSEHGVLNFLSNQGDILAAGGEGDRLYIASVNGVQEFTSSGIWSGEIPEPNLTVTAVAVDQTTQDIYAVNDNEGAIQKFDSQGKTLASFEVAPREAGRVVTIHGIAVDTASHLAVSGTEESLSERVEFGTLYNGVTDEAITNFTISEGTPSEGIKGITFNEKGGVEEDELYAAADPGENIRRYTPEKVAELTTGPASCGAGPENDTSATLNCSLEGHVNPNSVPKTLVWFEWGATCALGEDTTKQPLGNVTESLLVTALVPDLRPNSKFCYRLAGEDEKVQAPEELIGEKKEIHLSSVPPRTIGLPRASFVKSSSAVLFGELNPENSDTAYTFQYGPCADLEECSQSGNTATQVSAAYGRIGVTLEAAGLQPGTLYRYRLVAENQYGEESECVGEDQCEGSFETGPAPVPRATTTAFADVGATSATISGIADSDGQPATYSFEIGLDKGAATNYGTVISGSTGVAPITETVGLSGLQPATTYAYRIVVKSGYGTAVGQGLTFTTSAVPMLVKVPPVPQMLPVPKIAFPKTPLKKCKSGYARDKHGKCVKTKRRSSRKKQHK